MNFFLKVGGFHGSALERASQAARGLAGTQGLVVIIACVIHAFSATLAATALGASPEIAGAIAVATAVATYAIDRQIMQTWRVNRGEAAIRARLGEAPLPLSSKVLDCLAGATRLGIALIIAGVMSVGPTMTVAQKDIDQVIQADQKKLDTPILEEIEQEFLNRQDTAEAVVASASLALSNYDAAQTSIRRASMAADADRLEHLTVTRDRRLELQSRIDMKRKELFDARTIAGCESTGSRGQVCFGAGGLGATGNDGPGPEYTFALGQIDLLTEEIRVLEDELGQLSTAGSERGAVVLQAAADAARDQLVSQQKAALAALATLQENKPSTIETLLENHPDRTVLDPTTIFNRQHALGELVAASSHFGWTIFLLELLAFAAESLVLVSELTNRRASSYDIALAKLERDANRKIFDDEIIEENAHLDRFDDMARKRAESEFLRTYDHHLAQAAKTSQPLN